MARKKPYDPKAPRSNRGQGTVYEVEGRPTSSRWRGAISITQEGGKRRRIVVSGATASEVRTKMQKEQQRVERGDIEPRGRLTVGGWMAKWLKSQHERVRAGERRYSTYRSWDCHVRLYIDPHLGRKRLMSLRPSDVERMTTAMQSKGLTARTAASVRTTLRQALEAAQKDGILTQNVAALATKPTPVDKEMKTLDADETKRLLLATRDDEWGPLWRLLATSGLRLGEALGLDWDDIDLERGVIEVRKTWSEGEGRQWLLVPPKTARSRRSIPIPASTMDMLDNLHERASIAAGGPPTGSVFVNALGERPRPTSLNHAFRAALAKASLPRVRIHDLRHGAASLMLEQGIDLTVVSRMLGHASATFTFNVYGHIRDDAKRNAANALGAALD